MPDDAARQASASWKRVSDVYRRHCPKGDTTPRDLATKLNYRNQLVTQMPPTLSVVYNKSGQRLRAATATAIVENKLYRVSVGSQREGDYLTAVLNAPALRFAFEFARKSGRHFDKTPLEKVPIPLYRPGDADHERLADLSASIRKARAADPEFNYPADCEAELNEIDELVRKLLPDFCR